VCGLGGNTTLSAREELPRIEERERPFLLTMLLDVIEKSHEAEIHMQLLVAVEKG